MAGTIQLSALRVSLPDLVETANEVASQLRMGAWGVFTRPPEHIEHLDGRVQRLNDYAEKTEGQPQTTRIPDSIAGTYRRVLETIRLLSTNKGYYELVGHSIRTPKQRQEDRSYMLREWRDD